MLRPHRLLCALVLAATAWGQVTVAPSPPTSADEPAGGERPRAAQRIVRAFDFEHQYNPLELPEGWVRAQDDPLVPRVRPGFPIWNLGRLDEETPAHSGKASVRFSIEGGSASLRLKAGELPIFPLGQYRVRAWCRCEGLVSARPRLVVRALDAEGRAIAGSDRGVVAEEVGDGWAELSVDLPGRFADAAYLQIDLEVVQPREFRPELMPGHQVWDEDFKGTVWFDDVVVAQVPQLRLETGSALNVIARPEAPVLHATLRDLAAQDMTAEIRVYDARRRVAASARREITSGRVSWDWTPELPGLGWYRAVIEIRAGGSLISGETCDFVYVDGLRARGRLYGSGPSFAGMETRAAPRARQGTGVELSALPPGGPGALAGALRALGVRSVTAPVWTKELTAAGVAGRVDELRELVTDLREAWIEPRLSLPVVPEALAGSVRVGRGEVVGALAGDASGWGPYLLEALDRLGTTTGRWQLGSAGDVASFDRPDLASDVAAARSNMTRLVPGMRLALGWRADLSERAAAASGADIARVALPAWTSATPAGAIVDPWREAAGSESGVQAEYVLEPMGDARHTERDVAADLARRTAELWGAATAVGPDGDAESPGRGVTAAIADPWRIVPGEEPAAHPTVAAAAWRALSDRLDGRQLAAEWPVTAGVRCLVFGAPAGEPERGGLIVAWNQRAAPGDARLHATLGDEPVTVYDIFGNSRRVEPSRSPDGTRLEFDLALSDEPVFIEDINTELVLFLAGVGMDPAEFESVTGEQQHAITLVNPWDVGVAGRVVVVSPGGYDGDAGVKDRTWEVTPRTLPFQIPAGGSARLPLVVSFSRSVEAGAQRFEFDIELTADRDYGWLRARTEGEVMWEGIELDLTYRVPPGGAEGDVIIEATVTNTGDVARALEAIAYAPGQPRARSSIGMLEPGQSVIRRLPFEDAARALAGKRVLVSISDASGPGRLTKSLALPGR